MRGSVRALLFLLAAAAFHFPALLFPFYIVNFELDGEVSEPQLHVAIGSAHAEASQSFLLNGDAPATSEVEATFAAEPVYRAENRSVEKAPDRIARAMETTLVIGIVAAGCHVVAILFFAGLAFMGRPPPWYPVAALAAMALAGVALLCMVGYAAVAVPDAVKADAERTVPGSVLEPVEIRNQTGFEVDDALVSDVEGYKQRLTPEHDGSFWGSDTRTVDEPAPRSDGRLRLRADAELSWHPGAGWFLAAAACAVVLIGLFVSGKGVVAEG